jgi:beta-galactosidase
MTSHLNLEQFRRETVTAAVYTNCDEAELWINGKLLGRRRPADFENNIIEWTFEYAEGELKTIGYRGGNEVCSYTLKTAGAAKRLLLVPDKTVLASGDIALIALTLADEQGLPCPHEEALVEFALTGDGEILGACSPDITSALGFRLPKTYTADGMAQVIIRAGACAGGLELTAYSERLQTAALRFTHALEPC